MFADKRRAIETGGAIVILLALFIGYFPILNAYRNEAATRTVSLTVGDEKITDRLNVFANVLSLDPLKGDMVVRLQFEPKGTLLAPDNYSITRDLTMLVSTSSGSAERAFSKGKPMSPFEVTLSLYDGLPTEYPFDAYKADLDLILTAPPKNGKGDAEDIPFVTELFASVHGYQIESSIDPETSEGATFMVFKVARSFTTVFFSVFVMILMWVLALCVLAWALSVLIRGRRIEATLFGWVGAMLFAFPALRNAVPGAPPVGSFSDYLAFFWAEALVMISVVIVVYSYLSRPLK